MARLAAQAKGGYYPTPPAEMAHVAARLAVEPGSSVNLLDPCAGRGEALRQLADALAAKGAKVATYGVEIERERAEAAAQILDRVVKGGYEHLRCSRGVMSLMWLNPPYDHNRLGGRVEVDFLWDLTAPDGYLVPGGLVMYCIPQESLAPAALLLATRLQDLAVYRFTDAGYPAFHQVVVFGYRTKTRRGPEARRDKERLEALARAGPEALPPLDADDGVRFSVPPAPGPVALFRGGLLDPEEIARDVAASPLWEKLPGLLVPDTGGARLRRPLLPLKLAHMALAIAAGAVDGNMGTHILEGTARKVVDRTEEDAGDGTTRVVEVERHVTTVRVFTREGVYELT